MTTAEFNRRASTYFDYLRTAAFTLAECDAMYRSFLLALEREIR